MAKTFHKKGKKFQLLAQEGLRFKYLAVRALEMESVRSDSGSVYLLDRIVVQFPY